MKNWKVMALFDSPLRLVIAVGLLIMATELLIMLVVAEVRIPWNIPDVYWNVLDAILLTLIISPVLYSLVFQKLQSEERFRQINASAQDAIAIADDQGRITDWNPAAQRMFQYSREEALGRQMHRLLVPARDQADAERGFARFQQTGEGPLLGKIREVTAIRKDGSEFPVEIYISALKVKGRWHAVGVMRDITRRKQAEEALRKLNEELEGKVKTRTADMEHAMIEAKQANRAKSDFLATMSHEIRTPMNGVIGMIDVLHQSSLRGYQVEMVDLIRESAYSLLGIINDILDFSKIEANKLEIERVPLAVDEVVESVGSMLDDMAEKKGVRFTLFTDPEIPAQVLGDPLRLRQVLINLANNAIKFSGKQQSGRVSLRATLVEDDSHLKTVRPELVEGLGGSTGSPRTAGGDLEQVTLEFRVIDNGIGIDEATRARLFTPFSQADISTTRRFGGTGLGLAIVHHLVELMGGEIAVQSAPGKGSTFSVRLPFGLPPEQPAVAASPVAGLPCLVTGGTESLAGDLAAYLAHDGAQVVLAQDLAAARAWIARQPPSLCVAVIDTTDANAPSLDGLRAAAQARPELDLRYVVLGRGGRRQSRVAADGLVELDAEVIRRRAFLRAVAVAAGRVQAEEHEISASGRSAAAFRLPPRGEALRQGRLILVAEDNETNQKVILRQLALLGFAADIADNGREALHRWQSGDYALLFADLHMPEMDGYELAAAIRAEERRTGKYPIPIIAFTANALKGEAERCQAAGMDDYLSKPVQLVDLNATLGKWLPAAPEPLPGAPAAPAAPASTAAPVDVSVLKALVGDDDALIREFLHDFRISAAQIAVELRAACAAGQAAAAGALAHKLKSSSRSVGALALGELCAAMEKAGKGGDAAALAVLLPEFERELAGVERFLEDIEQRG